MQRPAPLSPARRLTLQRLSALSLAPWLPGGLALAAAASALNALPRTALVIGNGKYKNAPLPNPANDAGAIGERLGKLGFKVISQIDASRDAMHNAVAAYGEQLAKSKGVGLFYFAGHGLQLSWRNFLVPVDANLARADDVVLQTLDLRQLFDRLGKAGNAMNIVILDACRDNPFGSELKTGKGLSQMDAPIGTLLAYATAPGNVASDGSGDNGLYTEHLLREIDTPAAKIEDVFKRVRLGVRRASKGQQVPWESTSLEDDFYFLPPADLKKKSQEELDRLFAEEAAAWERAQAAKAAKALEEKKATEAAKALEDKKAIEAAKALEDKKAAEAPQPQPIAEVKPAEKPQPPAPAARPAEEKRTQAPVQAAAAPPAEGAEAVKLIEDYLQRYPSGHFSELAAVQLDRILAEQGEQKVKAVSAAENPFTLGTGVIDLNYRVGDRYAYRRTDLLTRVVEGTNVNRVTDITANRVIYNNGAFVTDLLGNSLKAPNGATFAASQVFIAEYSLGKKWTTRFDAVLPNGSKDTYEIELRVVGRETITVPAGSFDCYRVEGTGWILLKGVKLEIKYWVAPDKVNRFIAQEWVGGKNGRFGRSDRMVLESYFRAG